MGTEQASWARPGFMKDLFYKVLPVWWWGQQLLGWPSPLGTLQTLSSNCLLVDTNWQFAADKFLLTNPACKSLIITGMHLTLWSVAFFPPFFLQSDLKSADTRTLGLWHWQGPQAAVPRDGSGMTWSPLCHLSPLGQLLKFLLSMDQVELVHPKSHPIPTWFYGVSSQLVAGIPVLGCLRHLACASCPGITGTPVWDTHPGDTAMPPPHRFWGSLGPPQLHPKAQPPQGSHIPTVTLCCRIISNPSVFRTMLKSV